MAHDIVKIVLTLAVLGLVAAVVALFVSGYLSAFKPGDKGIKSPASAVSSARGARIASPSPSPGINATMPVFPGQARYAPPRPIIPEHILPPVAPPMLMGGDLPLPSATVVPPEPSYAVPRMPSAPGISTIIDFLFRILPLIYSYDFDLTPVWPRLPQ